jgi:hypothetical protein
VKKLFALFAVAALATVGCDDKKSTSKTTGTGGTYRATDTVRVDSTKTVTDTVIRGTDTVRNTDTVRVTRTVDSTKDKGPTIPGTKDKNDKNDK